MSFIGAVLFGVLWLWAPVSLMTLLWWELRNGRIPPFVGVPALRVSQPWLFWTQITGQAFATTVAGYIAGVFIIAAISARISN